MVIQLFIMCFDLTWSKPKNMIRGFILCHKQVRQRNQQKYLRHRFLARIDFRRPNPRTAWNWLLTPATCKCFPQRQNTLIKYAEHCLPRRKFFQKRLSERASSSSQKSNTSSAKETPPAGPSKDNVQQKRGNMYES